MRGHVAAFRTEAVALLLQDCAVRADQDRAEGMIAALARTARHVERAAQERLVVERGKRGRLGTPSSCAPVSSRLAPAPSAHRRRRAMARQRDRERKRNTALKFWKGCCLAGRPGPRSRGRKIYRRAAFWQPRRRDPPTPAAHKDDGKASDERGVEELPVRRARRGRRRGGAEKVQVRRDLRHRPGVLASLRRRRRSRLGGRNGPRPRPRADLPRSAC